MIPEYQWVCNEFFFFLPFTRLVSAAPSHRIDHIVSPSLQPESFVEGASQPHIGSLQSVGHEWFNEVHREVPLPMMIVSASSPLCLPSLIVGLEVFHVL